MQVQTPTPSKSEYDKSRKMLACRWHGKEDIKAEQVPVPLITDPTDAIVRVTATSIGGSDLHMYHSKFPGLEKGDIIGHESVGVIDQVGSQVSKLKKGDRVVISPIISCGECDYCKRREWSCCETTNPSKLQEEQYGSRTCGLLGYSCKFGGYDGCQAEFVRVPFAEVNLFPIPNNITDKQAVLVSDVASSSFHANVLADTKEGDRVVVIGSGPVGLLTQMWAKARGASIVVAIDVDQSRLELAKRLYKSETINAKDTDVLEAVKKIIPGGPDKVIDCVGFRFPEEALHKTEMLLKAETDSPNIVNLAIKMVRKNGRITLIGDYVGSANQFNIGAFMEKHLTMNGGQSWPHNYSSMIFEAISSGKIDPTVVITHTFPLSKCEEAYKRCDRHEDDCMKVLLLPDDIYDQTEGARTKK